MKNSDYVMDEEERQLWHQVYAVAFVAQFNKDVTNVTNGYCNPLEKAARHITAERASFTADLAVLKLRDYKDVKELTAQVIHTAKF